MTPDDEAEFEGATDPDRSGPKARPVTLALTCHPTNDLMHGAAPELFDPVVLSVKASRR